MERDFDFPGTPYDVQQDFMKELYDCLSSFKVGIFESPTGTGKSLSIVCGSFKWFKDFGAKIKNDRVEGAPDWVNEMPLNEEHVFNDITNVERDSRRSSVAQKIVYVSRTHSQLDQFLNEIKKTRWKNEIKIVRIGSRSQLCVNPEIASYKGRSLIDYKCKELVNPERPLQCSYYKNVVGMKNHVLSTCCDIEDLVSYGKLHNACPYYATRNSIGAAEVILAPYTSVLNSRNRESVGLDLTDCVLIIDEAHNIIEAMIDCHSAQINRAQAEGALLAIDSYYQRFSKKVGANASLNFQHLILLLRSLINFMQMHKKPMSIDIGSFLIESKLQKMEFFKLLTFCEEFELGRKVITQSEKSGNKGSIVNIGAFIDFLRVLCDDISVGKILVNHNEESNLRYYLLNPRQKFVELANLTRCLVLAGGTMEPKAEYLDLFSVFPTEKIKQFQCSHIIPPQNLLMAVVNKGESGKDFKFTYENRDNSLMIQDLHQLILDLCVNVPNGIVVFVASFIFLSKLKVSLEKSGMFDKISQHKKVFFDNKDENILQEFSVSALNSGAILFAVVRGKLSEGINFSDHLGRCVVMVGMPYLNKSDIEIQERMRYLDVNSKSFSGKMYYESSCHKAINQSIGRAIRHQGDFSVVLLVDERHSGCLNKRPEWMKRNLAYGPDLMEKIRIFFKSH